ncbi:MAG: MFS transporter [Pseudomonadota bacterium]
MSSGHAQDEAANATQERLLAPAYRRATLGIVVLTSLVAFESMAVATAMPIAATQLDALSWYALAFASTLAASAVGIAIAGIWSDARGPSAPTWCAIGALVLGSALAGLADHLTLLLVGRVVQGLAVGAIGVTLYVLAASSYPASMHGRVLSAMSTAWVLPALIGPAISGLIVGTLGWRWVFLLVALASAPAAMLLAPILKSSEARRGQLAPRAGSRVGWSIVAAGGLALTHASGHSAGASSQALSLVMGLGLLALGARALLPAGTLRLARGLPSVVAVRALAAAAFFSAEAFVPLLLIERYAFSAGLAGLSLTGAALGWASGAHWYSRGRQERDPRGVLHLGAFIMFTGLLLIVAVLAFALPPTLVIVAWSIMGLGIGMQRPALGVLLIRLAPPGAIGASASALQMGDAIAIAATLAITGGAFAALHDTTAGLAYGLVFAVSMGLLAIAAVGAERVLAPRGTRKSRSPSVTGADSKIPSDQALPGR